MTNSEINEKIGELKSAIGETVQKLHTELDALKITHDGTTDFFERISETLLKFPSEHWQEAGKRIQECLSNLRVFEQEIKKLELQREDGPLEKTIPKPEPKIMIKRPLNILAQAEMVGEPVFILRAQDNLAMAALDDYYFNAERKVALHKVSPNFTDSVNKIRSEFESWRKANPDKCKYPD